MNKSLEKRNAKVLALVNSGYTYQQVADAMKMTRNAVAGVVYRDKLFRDLSDLADLRALQND